MISDSSTKKRRPTVKDMITRPFLYTPTISPDGKKVAYTKLLLDFSNNLMVGPLFIYDVETKQTYQILENGAYVTWLGSTSCLVVRHSPSGNSRWSAVYIVEDMIGEGSKVYEHSSQLGGITTFAKGFLFLSDKSIDKSRVGDFIHVENELSRSALYYVSIERSISNEEQKRLFFKEENHSDSLSKFEITANLDAKYKITSFITSQVANAIYLNCQIGTDLYFERETACFKLEIDPESILEKADKASLEDALSNSTFQELSLPKGFHVKAVSPDGMTLLVSGPVPELHGQPRDELWLISELDASNPDYKKDPFAHIKLISKKLDRNAIEVHWTKQGIFVKHWNESKSVISLLEENGDFHTFDLGHAYPSSEISITDQGDFVFVGFSPDYMMEVYAGKLERGRSKIDRISKETENFSHLDLGTVESIRWKSKDGTEIEGVLRKPSNFDSSRKYPLLLYPHGGPSASSPLALVDNNFPHPVHSLLAKGVLILEPNYRGSIGRGWEFQHLNYNNLGVGDLWDLESGIDYLIEQGFVDETKIGSMGGSQGGYLSMYIGTHTDRCVAVASFAGVSSWYLYYIGSDARHTVHLEGTPYEPEAQEMYRKSAPIAAIETAKTPMLLHHGEKDERITVVSSQEMYRALKDKGVHTELFILPGKGHGFITPRENYAISLHEYRWFCHYLLGEESDLFKDDW